MSDAITKANPAAPLGVSTSAETLSPPRTTTLPSWNDVHTWAVAQKFNADELEAARNLFFEERIQPMLGPDELAAGRELFDQETKPGFFERVGDSLGISDRARAVSDARLPEPKRGGPLPGFTTGDGKWDTDRFDGLLNQAERDYGLVDKGLPAGTLTRMALTESSLNPGAVSGKGARGLMQLMPGTARRYGVKDPHDPVESVSGAARYMSDLLTMFNGDPYSAVAAYNAGEGTVRSYLTGKPLRVGGKIINPEGRITPHGIPPYQETQEYVRKNLAPEGGGFDAKREGGYLSADVKIAVNNLADIFDGAWVAEMEESERANNPTDFAARLAANPRVQRAYVDIARRRDENKRLQADLRPESREFLNSEGEWDAQLAQMGRALAKNPAGVLADLSIQSGPQMVGIMLAGLLAARGQTGLAGTMLAGGKASQMMNFGSEYLQNREKGLPHDKAYENALWSSHVIGMFDGVSLGEAGRSLRRVMDSNVLGALGHAAKSTASQGALGGGGDVWADFATGETPEPRSFVPEIVGEMATGPVDAVTGYQALRGSGRDGAGVPPAAASPPGAEGEPTSQPSSASAGEGAEPPSQPSPAEAGEGAEPASQPAGDGVAPPDPAAGEGSRGAAADAGVTGWVNEADGSVSVSSARPMGAPGDVVDARGDGQQWKVVAVTKKPGRRGRGAEVVTALRPVEPPSQPSPAEAGEGAEPPAQPSPADVGEGSLEPSPPAPLPQAGEGSFYGGLPPGVDALSEDDAARVDAILAEPEDDPAAVGLPDPARIDPVAARANVLDGDVLNTETGEPFTRRQALAMRRNPAFMDSHKIKQVGKDAYVLRPIKRGGDAGELQAGVQSDAQDQTPDVAAAVSAEIGADNGRGPGVDEGGVAVAAPGETGSVLPAGGRGPANDGVAIVAQEAADVRAGRTESPTSVATADGQVLAAAEVDGVLTDIGGRPFASERKARLVVKRRGLNPDDYVYAPEGGGVVARLKGGKSTNEAEKEAGGSEAGRGEPEAAAGGRGVVDVRAAEAVGVDVGAADLIPDAGKMVDAPLEPPSQPSPAEAGEGAESLEPPSQPSPAKAGEGAEAATGKENLQVDESPEKAKAREDLQAALGDLGQVFLDAGLFSKKAVPTAEIDEAKLIPVLARVLDASFRLGYHAFKDAARFALGQIRENFGDGPADAVTLDHLQGAYIAMSGKYREKGADSKRDVIAVESLDELVGDEPSPPAPLPQAGEGGEPAKERETPEPFVGDGDKESLGDEPATIQQDLAGEAKPAAFAAEKTEPVKKSDGSPRIRLAQRLANLLGEGEKISAGALTRIADHAFGGTMAEGKYSSKDAYDAMETAVNLYIYANSAMPVDASVDRAKRVMGQLRELMDRLPTQTRRDQEMDEFQQFSTPPDLAYVANWVAKITAADTMMEPSAGTGDLAIWADKAGAKIVLNELSPRRAELLRPLFPDARLFTENAEQLNNVLPRDVVPTVVVMNPPFSATAGRVQGERDSMNGARHIEQALKRLAPGGRLVAIVGEGMAADRPRFRKWWREIKSQYNVRANVGLDGSGYRKYGTTFDNQILVIDKTGPTTAPEETGFGVRLESPTLLLNVLEDIRNDRKPITSPDQPATVEQGRVEVAEKDRLAEQSANGSSGADVAAVGASDAKPGRAGKRRDGAKGGRDGGLAGASSDGVSDRPGADRGRVDSGAGVSEPSDAGGRGVVSDRRADGGDAGDERSAVDDGVQPDEPVGELTEAIFDPYKPQKLRVPGAKKHPGKLVQSAAMAAVNPPDPTYKPSLPRDVIDEGRLSDAQIEAVTYAGQSHQEFLPNGERRGFFIGDGTGVGKGREISGIILDNLQQGRKKAVWVSFNEGLINDARRDFSGVGGDADTIFWQGKTKASGEITAKDGILFTTYATLRGGEKKQAAEEGQKQGKTRIAQIAEWLGPDFDGALIFDEAHKMGNALPMKGKRGVAKASQQALAGIELQAMLPKARVVYVSATGATEVMNLAYASRLGLWGEGTPFASVKDFVHSVASGGVAAMELVSRDMKALGMYLARSLSFDGVTYARLEHNLTPLQRDIYNELASAWQGVLANVNAALKETGQGKNADAKSSAMSRFWGTHQRFFNQIITALMTPSVLTDIRRQLDDGHAVVIQLTNTNEAEQERQAARAKAEDVPLEDMDFTPRQALMEYVRNGFPVQQFHEVTDEDGNKSSVPTLDSNGDPVMNADMVARRDELLKTLEAIRVPGNPIDEIIEAFGDDVVAEVTGRGRRFVRKRGDNGEWKLEEQKRGANAARADATAFQADRKKILIFSDAGGTGYSFHADNTAQNQRKRVHYILQPGWRADGAVQGFGRTHRTNQASEPHYVLPTTDLKAQKRFVSSIARRLDQLGALTRGQRDAGSQGLFTATDNLESKYAQEALFNFFTDLVRGRTPLPSAQTLEAMGLESVVDKKTGAMNQGSVPAVPQFLNRLLSLTMEQQDAVFDQFLTRLEDVVQYAVDSGTYDTGLQTLKARSIRKVADQPVHKDERTGAETRYVELDVTNPVVYTGFDEALRTAKGDALFGGEMAGFYRNVKSGRVYMLVDQGKRIVGADKEEERGKLYGIKGTRRIDTVSAIKRGKEYRKVGDRYEDVQTWDQLDESAARQAWGEEIANAPKEETERKGLLAGVILPIWDRVVGSRTIYRLQTDDGERFLGQVLSGEHEKQTLKNLGVGSGAARLPVDRQYAAVLGGTTAVLANGWEIKAVRVAGEKRLEVMSRTMTPAEQEQLKGVGAFVERINWAERVFLPVGDRGEAVFAAVVKSRPVVDLLGNEGDGRFSRAGSAGVNTVDGVVNALSGRFGKRFDVLRRRGLVRVVASQTELPAVAARAAGVVRGYFDGKTAWLNAGGIEPGSEVGVFLHEAGIHQSLEDMLGAAKYRALADGFETLLQRGDATAEAVERQVSRLNLPADVAADERIAYAVERFENERGSVGFRRWIRRVLGALKTALYRSPFGAWLQRHGMEMGPAEMAALARAAVRWRAGFEPPSQPSSAEAVEGAGGFSREDVTETAAFKRWFGDSKVVDADGKPLVVYHGTREDFDAFDGEALAANPWLLGDDKKNGFFFTVNPGKRSDSGRWTGAAGYAGTSQKEGETVAPSGANVMPVYLSIQLPYKMTAAQYRERAGRRDFSEELEALGYDGVEVDDGTFIAFSPAQIKSATGNSGTFDPANPDIRFSRDEQGRFSRAPEPGGFDEVLAREDAEIAKSLAGWRSKDRFIATARGWSEKTRRAALGAFTLMQLADVAEHLLPGIKHDYLRIVRRMAADRNEIHEKVGHVVKAWGGLARGAGRVIAERMARLMHEATLAGVDPAPWFDVKEGAVTVRSFPLRAEAEAFVNAPEQADAGYRIVERAYTPVVDIKEALARIKVLEKKALGRNADNAAIMGEIKQVKNQIRQERRRQQAYGPLKARWDRLPAEYQQVYVQARDYHTAVAEDILAALEDRINDSDATGRVKRDMIARLRQEFESNRVEAPYFPLSRFGNFWIHYLDTDGVWRFVTEESLAAQKEVVQDLERAGVTRIDKGEQFDGLSRVEGVSAQFVAQVEGLIRDMGDAPEVQALGDEVWQLYLKTLPAASMRKHFIHRKKKKGYSEDALRAFAKKGFHDAYQLARLRWAHKLEKSQADMTKDVALAENQSARKRLEAERAMVEEYTALAENDNALDVIDGELGRINADINAAIAAKRPVGDALNNEAAKMERFRKWYKSDFDAQAAIDRLTERLDNAARIAAVKDGYHEATGYLRELAQFHEVIMNPPDTSLAQGLNSFGFAWFLGASVRAALVNTVQTPVVAMPVLAGRFGSYGKAMKEVNRAALSFFKNGAFSVGPHLQGDEARAFAEWHRSGLLDKTLAHDIAGIAEDGVDYNGLRYRLMQGLSIAFHSTERLNREATALAAYRLARDAGMNHDDAVYEAEALTWRAHGDYSSDNRARFMRGNARRVIFQFKQYSQNMTYLWLRSVWQALRGASVAEKAQGRKVLGGMLAMQLMFAGIRGLPLGPLYLALRGLDQMGDPDEPWDWEERFKRALKDRAESTAISLGMEPTQAEAASLAAEHLLWKGGVDALTPWSIADSISMSEMWLRDPDKEMEKADDWYWYAMSSALGPQAGLLHNMINGAMLIADGKVERGLEKMVPSFAAGPMKAWRYSTEGGATNLKGDYLLRDMTAAEIVGQAAGFTPSRLARRYDFNSAVKNAETRLSSRRADLLTDVAEGKPGALGDSIRFTRKNPSFAIMPEDYLSSAKARAKRSAQSEGGLSLSRRALGLKRGVVE